VQYRRYIYFCLLLSCIPLLFCPGQRPPSILNFGVFITPSSLDPAYTQDFAAAKILPNIFDTLVQYEDSTLKTQPALAESVRISPDATCWTFYLRRDVRFHDGTGFNAEAVKISFDRLINPQSEFYVSHDYVSKRSSLKMIDRIEILDPYTLRFHLSYPYASFHHSVATCFGASIVSPAALRKYGSQFKRHPVGTGPFRLEAWKDNKYITLSANESYWGGRPKIEKIHYIVEPRRADQLIKGSLHIAEEVGATIIDRLYLKPDIHLVFAKAIGITVLGFQCQIPPLTDVRIRRAIALAFNKEKFVHTMMRGRGKIANGPLPPPMSHRETHDVPGRYDPESAKKLLVEAGYPNGFQVDLWCFYVSERSGVLPLAIQKDLGRIGIQVDIKYIDDWDIYNTGVTNGDAPLFVDGWRRDAAAPENYFFPIFHTEGEGNLFQYSNADLDHLLEQARRTIDGQRRMELYAQAQQVILSDQPCVFISYYNEVFALKNCVQGFFVGPLGMVRLNHVECHCQ
jgi:peptide/nickel transport system substrate-binding protein